MRDGTEKLPTPDSHVNGENCAKTMVYNMKRNSKKKRDERKIEKKKGLRNITVKRENSKLLITLQGFSRGCLPYYVYITFLPKHLQSIFSLLI